MITHSTIKEYFNFVHNAIRPCFTIFLLLALLYSCEIIAQQSINTIENNISSDSVKMLSLKIKQANKEFAAKATITHFVMKNNDDTYGYAIFIDGNMSYHQPNIPAVSGNNGFTKREHAEAAALLAIHKIKEGENPPTLSEEEVQFIIKP